MITNDNDVTPATFVNLFGEEAEARLRAGFGDHSSYPELRPHLERFARDLAIEVRDVEPPFASLGALRTGGLSFHVGTAIALWLTGGRETDVSLAMCEHYAEIGLYINLFEDATVVDLMIERGRSRMAAMLRKVVDAAVEDERQFDRRAATALSTMELDRWLALWTSRHSSTPDRDRVFDPAEQLLLEGRRIDQLRNPANSARQALFKAHQAFWEAYDRAR